MPVRESYSPETEAYIAHLFAMIELRSIPPMTRAQFREMTKQDWNGPRMAEALCA